MSSLPPPSANRVPLAKSAPATRAATKRGISLRVRRTVRIQHDDDVAGRCSKPAGERVALASAVLLHDPHIRAQRPGHLDGAVDAPAVDQDHLVDVGGQSAEHVRKIPGLVAGRDDDADRRTGGAARGLQVEANRVWAHEGFLSELRRARSRCCSPPGHGDQYRPVGHRRPTVLAERVRNVRLRSKAITPPGPMVPNARSFPVLWTAVQPSLSAVVAVRKTALSPHVRRLPTRGWKPLSRGFHAQLTRRPGNSSPRRQFGLRRHPRCPSSAVPVVAETGWPTGVGQVDGAGVAAPAPRCVDQSAPQGTPAWGVITTRRNGWATFRDDQAGSRYRGCTVRVA